MGHERDTFEEICDHKIDNVSQASNVASIVVPYDVVLLLENRRQRFNHSVVVRGIVSGDAMKFVT